LRAALAPIAAAAALWAMPGWVTAGGTVKACKSDMQTGAGLNLSTAMANGGVIDIACGANDTLVVSKTYVVIAATAIRGTATLKAASAHAMFDVRGDLTLRGLGLTNPYLGLGGGVYSRGVASGAGALTLAGIRVTGSVNPISVENVTVQEQSRFQNNSGVLISAGIISISDSDFIDNPDAVVLQSNRPPGSGRTTVAWIDHGRFRHNRAAIQWSGRLTIRSGEFQNNGSMIYDGGAVRLAVGPAAIDNTIFDGNTAPNGGAIWLESGALTLDRAIFRDNSARADGGAVGAGDTGAATIVARHSTFIDNHAQRGGAIRLTSAGGAPTLVGGPNTFARNRAERGGAIFSEIGGLQLQRGVFLDNIATLEGGAIYASRRGPPWAALLANSLVARNQAPVGAAVSGSAITLINTTVAGNRGPALTLPPLSHFAPSGLRPTLELRNAILTGNRGGNCAPLPAGLVVLQNGHNLQFPSGDCPGAAVADPKLSPLFEPGPDSPARIGGDNATCLAAPILGRDVYGALRPQGQTCSVGAVEGDMDPRVFRTLLHRLAERARLNLKALPYWRP
jgi:predicted outer membrane repeat protein